MSPRRSKQKLSIGIVCPYNIFGGGGVQECVLALRDGLRDRGHNAVVITPQPRGNNTSPDDGTVLLGGSTPTIKAFHTSSQLAASIDIDKLDTVLGEYKFDILHFHEPWVPILSRQILHRSRSINVGTFHAAMSERRASKTLEKVVTPYTKPLLKYLHVMTAVSPAATNYLKSLTSRRPIIIPNGIDLDKYKHQKPSSNSRVKTIFYIGRLEKRKGVKYLINAFGLLNAKSKDHYQLLIAGDGPDSHKLRQYVLDQRISGVRFLGYVSEERKLELFSKADLFCSPALYGESFGIVLLEAMATNCVTVAGNNAGYESVMKGAGAISLVNPKDKIEFARRLGMMSGNDALRDTWRKWAGQEVKQYDYNNVIDQYLSLYLAVYERKKRA